MYPEETDELEPVKKSSSDLLPRFLSALVLIPAALAAMYFGGLIWTGLIALCLLALGFEWSAMVLGKPVARLHQMVFLLALTAAYATAFFVKPIVGVSVGGAVGVIYMVWGISKASRSLFWLGFGAIYLSLGAISLDWLRLQSAPNGLILVLFLFIVVWATDIGAYCMGRLVGGPKIFPSVSPNKTWSGSMGGVVIAVLLAVLLKPAFGLLGTYFGLSIAAIGLSCVSQAGDALESALKRMFEIKDTGTIIPGHGGVLDRLDALLLAAPVMAAFVWVTQ